MTSPEFWIQEYPQMNFGATHTPPEVWVDKLMPALWIHTYTTRVVDRQLYYLRCASTTVSPELLVHNYIVQVVDPQLHNLSWIKHQNIKTNFFRYFENPLLAVTKWKYIQNPSVFLLFGRLLVVYKNYYFSSGFNPPCCYDATIWWNSSIEIITFMFFSRLEFQVNVTNIYLRANTNDIDLYYINRTRYYLYKQIYICI